MKKLTHVFVFVALIVMSASSTSAQTDPHIGLGPGGSCNGPFIETSLTQSFNGVTTGCPNDFTNDIPGGVTLFKLVITIAGVSFPQGQISCDLLPNSPFPGGEHFQSSPNSCTFQADDAITPGLTYSLTIDNAFSSTGFVNLSLSQHVVPEPASIALLGTGLAALVARRKKLGSRPLAS